MFVALGVNILSITGNYLCLYRPFGMPQLSIKGVAISLVSSQFIGVVALTFILIKKVKVRFRLKYIFPFPFDILKLLLRIGTPAAGELIAFTTSQMFTTYIATGFGPNALTAMVYMQNFSGFTSSIATSIGQGTQIMTGHLVGAGEINRAYKNTLKATKLVIVLSIVASVTMLLLRFKVIGIFTQNPDLIKLISNLFFIAVIIETSRSINNIVSNSIKGAGDVKFPMYLSILSMWGISALLCFLLGYVAGLGLVGIWIAFAADETTRAIFFCRHWLSDKWKSKALIKKNTVCS